MIDTITAGGVGFVTGILSRDIVPWLISEVLESRKQRREWYAELARITDRLTSLGVDMPGAKVVPQQRSSAFAESEEALTALANTELDIEDSLRADVGELRDRVSEVNTVVGVMGEDEHAFFKPGTGKLNEIQSLSGELNDIASERANSGLNVLGTRI